MHLFEDVDYRHDLSKHLYMKAKNFLLLFSALFAAIGAKADGRDFIRLNQVGYLPGQEKVIILDDYTPKKILVKNKVGKVVARPVVKRTAVSPFTGKTRCVIDVSDIRQPGAYTIVVDGNAAKFEVKNAAIHGLAAASAKAFYLMRSGMAIERQYAGQFERPLGHPDTLVLVHPSAASAERPEGFKISSPRGWYDAGDYNKYIVNSAFTISQMLAVYEQIPQYFAGLDLNIPESGNSSPDLLDEIMYNLKWMLTMQDPTDGGVYHKLTTPSFEGFVKPVDCHQQRYVVMKSVTASLDFAAVMAQAAKIYEKGFSCKCFPKKALEAAKAAYQWAKEHPDALYRQNEMNDKFKPQVFTGEYGDGDATDEWFWAATQLYLATGEKAYLEDAKRNAPNQFLVPTWGQVSGLAVYAWLNSSETEMKERCLGWLADFAEGASAKVATSNFQSPFGDEAKNFGWGCLAESFCAPAIALLFADKYVAPGKYRADALRTADYILGRNPLGYCYVTGFGTKSPMKPHQRISASDGIVAPMPGLLVGGPNPGQQDKSSNLTYPSDAPDESYLDEEGSYASNEIAINWNACLVGLMCWLDAMMQ